MSSSRFMGRQLRKPSGWFGSLVISRSMNRVNCRITQRSLELLEIGPNGQLPEIGFGGGIGIWAALQRLDAGAITGIDLSPEMVRNAEGRFRRENGGGRVRVQVGDIALSLANKPSACFTGISGPVSIRVVASFRSRPVVHPAADGVSRRFTVRRGLHCRWILLGKQVQGAVAGQYSCGLFMRLLLLRRIQPCLLRCARSDSSTYCQVRLRNPPVARLVNMPVCAASLRTIMNNPGQTRGACSQAVACCGLAKMQSPRAGVPCRDIIYAKPETFLTVTEAL